MHFLVHSAAPSCAPFTPHLESLTHPLTVAVSPANEAVANSETNANAASTNRNFRMPSSFRFLQRVFFDAQRFLNSITTGPPPHLRKDPCLLPVFRASGRRPRGRIGGDVDILPRPCIVQLFPSFSLDGTV